MIEAGARFVTVYWGKEIQDWAGPFKPMLVNNPWDTHRNHFPLIKDSLIPRADNPLKADAKAAAEAVRPGNKTSVNGARPSTLLAGTSYHFSFAPSTTTSFSIRLCSATIVHENAFDENLEPKLIRMHMYMYMHMHM